MVGWGVVPMLALALALIVAWLGGCDSEVWPTGDPFAQPLTASQTAARVELGRQLFKANACYVCHSIDGSSNTGPSLRGVYGSQVLLNDGSAVTADADYIRRSIRDPNAQIVRGFSQGMSLYPELRPHEVEALVFYIHSLREAQAQAAPPATAARTP